MSSHNKKLVLPLILLIASILVAILVVKGTHSSTDTSTDETSSESQSSSIVEDESNEENDNISSNNSVTIKSMGLTLDSSLGECIKFNISNNTDNDIIVENNYLAINGLMLGNGFFQATVSSGESSEELFQIPNQTDVLGIGAEYNDIEVQFKISNSSDSILSEVISVIDGGNTYRDISQIAIDTTGYQRLANDTGIEIYFKNNGISELGLPDIDIIVINESGSNKVVQSSYTKINGVDAMGSFYTYVANNKIAKAKLIFVSGEYNASKIDTIETGISIRNDDYTYQVRIETGEIAVNNTIDSSESIDKE